MNYFAEQHGKSICDSHFGVLSNWLKQAATSQHVNNIGPVRVGNPDPRTSGPSPAGSGPGPGNTWNFGLPDLEVWVTYPALL